MMIRRCPAEGGPCNASCLFCALRARPTRAPVQHLPFSPRRSASHTPSPLLPHHLPSLPVSLHAMSGAVVNVTIHAPTVPIVSERRLPADVPLRSILSRLELLTGIPPESQKISLWTTRTDDADSRASLIRECDDANSYAKSLADLGVQDGMGIKVEDTRKGEVRDQFGAEEEEKVEKYEMDDEAYAKRTGGCQKVGGGDAGS